jgi:hypothetical protein
VSMLDVPNLDGAQACLSRLRLAMEHAQSTLSDRVGQLLDPGAAFGPAIDPVWGACADAYRTMAEELSKFQTELMAALTQLPQAGTQGLDAIQLADAAATRSLTNAQPGGTAVNVRV